MSDRLLEDGASLRVLEDDASTRLLEDPVVVVPSPVGPNEALVGVLVAPVALVGSLAAD